MGILSMCVFLKLAGFCLLIRILQEATQKRLVIQRCIIYSSVSVYIYVFVACYLQLQLTLQQIFIERKKKCFRMPATPAALAELGFRF